MYHNRPGHAVMLHTHNPQTFQEMSKLSNTKPNLLEAQGWLVGGWSVGLSLDGLTD